MSKSPEDILAAHYAAFPHVAEQLKVGKSAGPPAAAKTGLPAAAAMPLIKEVRAYTVAVKDNAVGDAPVEDPGSWIAPRPVGGAGGGPGPPWPPIANPMSVYDQVCLCLCLLSLSLLSVSCCLFSLSACVSLSLTLSPSPPLFIFRPPSLPPSLPASLFLSH